MARVITASHFGCRGEPAPKPGQREDETALENIRRARRGVVCACIRRDDVAGGGKPDRLLPHRCHFRNAWLRLLQPGAMPDDVFRPRRQLLRESIPEQQQQQQRLRLSAEASSFKNCQEAGRESIRPSRCTVAWAINGLNSRPFEIEFQKAVTAADGGRPREDNKQGRSPHNPRVSELIPAIAFSCMMIILQYGPGALHFDLLSGARGNGFAFFRRR
jgi:hypothetical protein